VRYSLPWSYTLLCGGGVQFPIENLERDSSHLIETARSDAQSGSINSLAFSPASRNVERFAQLANRPGGCMFVL
jgi:hypothetical protein